MQKKEQNKAAAEAPQSEDGGEHEHNDTQEFEGVAKLMVLLRKARDGDKGHIENDLV